MLTLPDGPWVAIACGTIVLFAIFWILSPHPPVTKKTLRHIPELRFDQDDTMERYLTDSRSLLYRGYEKYLRHGIAFQMRNPVGELGPQLLLPMKYLDELKNAPMSLFSFKAFSEKSFLLNYSNGPQQTDAAAHVVKTDLTRNLGTLAESIYCEVSAALDQGLPDGNDWNTVTAYEFMTGVVARVTALVLVGPELCRNPEWLQLSTGTTYAVFGAAHAIRDNYSPRWRWLARWQNDAPKQMLAMRKKAVKLLTPLYKERVDAQKRNSSYFNDSLQWLLRLKSAEKSIDRIADQQLFLTIASIHTTSATSTSILFDMMAYPKYQAEILDDMKQAMNEKGDGPWTLQNVASMRKLDSFMKESQRMRPLGFITGQRVAMKPHTFKDGLHIPAGVIFQFPADAVHHDPEIYPDPHTFDPYRFLRLRETVDPNRFHFASVSDSVLNFGAGSHACPGRFFSALIIKFMLVMLMTRYEIKFEGDDQKRPADMVHDFTMVPNGAAKIMLKRKKCSV